MHTKTRIFPSLSQVLVLFQLGKTRWIARERSCLCRFSYKHRNVFSFQLFHGIGPAACLDKPFLIALIQAKETQHLHRLVCFRLACVFSSFPRRKKGDACARHSVFVLARRVFPLSELDFGSISDVFSVCGNGFVLAGPWGITPLFSLSHHQHLDFSWNDIWYQIRRINFPACWIKVFFSFQKITSQHMSDRKYIEAWKKPLIGLFWPGSISKPIQVSWCPANFLVQVFLFLSGPSEKWLFLFPWCSCCITLCFGWLLNYWWLFEFFQLDILLWSFVVCGVFL